MPYESLSKLIKGRRIDRKSKLYGREVLTGMLKGGRNDHKDGLLYKLNVREWNVEILDGHEQVLFSKGGLSQFDSTQLLKETVNKMGGVPCEKA